jgi:hypothetical protein
MPGKPVEPDNASSGISNKVQKAVFGEEVDVLRVIVRFGWHREHQLASRNPQRLLHCRVRLRDVLQRLQEGNAVEGPVLEIEICHVHAMAMKRSWPDGGHGLDTFDRLGIEIRAGDGQIGKCVEHGPEEASAPSPQIEQIRRTQALEQAKSGRDPWHQPGALEHVKVEPAANSLGDLSVSRQLRQIGKTDTSPGGCGLQAVVDSQFFR